MATSACSESQDGDKCAQVRGGVSPMCMGRDSQVERGKKEEEASLGSKRRDGSGRKSPGLSLLSFLGSAVQE